MNYFSYQPEVTGRVWSLFRELGEVTPEQRSRAYAGSEYSHTLEIVSAALSGAIATDPESVERFNLRVYEMACASNDAIGAGYKAKKELHIVDFDTSRDEDTVGYGDISSRDLKSDDDLLDALEGSIAFEENLRALLNIRTKYIVEQGVDVVSVLYSALNGIPDAVTKLKDLVKDNSLCDLVASLCEGGQSNLLRRLEVAGV